jgi:acetolactate synthase I/II/III large subunit
MPASPLPSVFTEKKVEAKALNGRGKAAASRKAPKAAKSRR